MTTDASAAVRPLVPSHPVQGTSASEWVQWFWADFLPAWVARAQDPEGGFHDMLDGDAEPPTDGRKTVLAQARLLFTFSHLALLSGDPAHRAAAQAAYDILPKFRKDSGLYARAVAVDGGPTGAPADALATSYDQSFVVLGLSTWGRLCPSDEVAAELEAVWQAIMDQLIDPATGLLLEHDGLDDPARADAPPRAQNPHMHNYEAALQAYEMTGNAVWLDRAAMMRGLGLAHFFDTDSGTITEFIAPDLSILPGRDGTRREVGHQCEWAWLLVREADLGGDPAMRDVAARLLAFADAHGFATDGPMQGAAFDAVGADAGWREDSFLLWPQTEAIKAHAIRAGSGDYGAKAQDLAALMFDQYFAGRAAYANQLNADTRVLWPDALSRLLYHIVLALTEGARAGLWPAPGAPRP